LYVFRQAKEKCIKGGNLMMNWRRIIMNSKIKRILFVLIPVLFLPIFSSTPVSAVEEATVQSIIGTLNNYFVDVPKYSNMNDDQKVEYILTKGRDRILGQALNIAKGSLKKYSEDVLTHKYMMEYINDYAAQKIYMTIILEGKQAGEAMKAKLLLEGSQKVYNQVQLLNLGATLGIGAIGGYLDNGLQGAFWGTTKTAGETFMKSMIPGYGWIKLVVQVETALINFAKDYIIQDQIMSALKLLYGSDMDGDGKGMSKYLSSKPKADIESDFEERWKKNWEEADLIGNFGYRAEGEIDPKTGKPFPVFKNDVKTKVMAMKYNIDKIIEQAKKDTKAVLDEESRKIQAQYQASEAKLKTEYDRVTSSIAPAIAKIGELEKATTKLTVTKVQEKVAKMAEEQKIIADQDIARIAEYRRNSGSTYKDPPIDLSPARLALNAYLAVLHAGPDKNDFVGSETKVRNAAEKYLNETRRMRYPWGNSLNHGMSDPVLIPRDDPYRFAQAEDRKLMSDFLAEEARLLGVEYERLATYGRTTSKELQGLAVESLKNREDLQGAMKNKDDEISAANSRISDYLDSFALNGWMSAVKSGNKIPPDYPQKALDYIAGAKEGFKQYFVDRAKIDKEIRTIINKYLAQAYLIRNKVESIAGPIKSSTGIWVINPMQNITPPCSEVYRIDTGKIRGGVIVNFPDDPIKISLVTDLIIPIYTNDDIVQITDYSPMKKNIETKLVEMEKSKTALQEPLYAIDRAKELKILLTGFNKDMEKYFGKDLENPTVLLDFEGKNFLTQKGKANWRVKPEESDGWKYYQDLKNTWAKMQAVRNGIDARIKSAGQFISLEMYVGEELRKYSKVTDFTDKTFKEFEKTKDARIKLITEEPAKWTVWKSDFTKAKQEKDPNTRKTLLEGVRKRLDAIINMNSWDQATAFYVSAVKPPFMPGTDLSKVSSELDTAISDVSVIIANKKAEEELKKGPPPGPTVVVIKQQTGQSQGQGGAGTPGAGQMTGNQTGGQSGQPSGMGQQGAGQMGTPPTGGAMPAGQQDKGPAAQGTMTQQAVQTAGMAKAPGTTAGNQPGAAMPPAQIGGEQAPSGGPSGGSQPPTASTPVKQEQPSGTMMASAAPGSQQSAGSAPKTGAQPPAAMSSPQAGQPASTLALKGQSSQEDMKKQQEELKKQQEALKKQQEALKKQQEELKKQEEIKKKQEEIKKQQEMMKGKVKELYNKFKEGYQSKNDSMVVGCLSSQWTGSDGASISDVQKALRNTFKKFDQVQYNITNLNITYQSGNTFKASYNVSITGRIFANNLKHEEQSSINDLVTIDDKGTAKITKTISGSMIKK
jgi:hypothetical protein